MHYHIIIPTVLSGYSQYIPHLIEHCVIRDILNPSFGEFLHRQIYIVNAETYTCSTEYIISGDTKILEHFIHRLCLPLNHAVIQREKKSLRDEYTEVTPTNLLIESIGRKLYKRFSYIKSKRVSMNQILQYHEQYYVRDNIHVLEEYPYSDETLGIIDFKLEGGRCKVQHIEYVYIIQNNTPINIYAAHFFMRMCNLFLRYTHESIGRYYWNEVQIGQFQEKNFIALPKDSIQLIASIDNSIISDYKNSLYSHFNRTDLQYIDNVIFALYKQRFSDKNIQSIMNQYDVYFFHIVSFLITPHSLPSRLIN